jgi:hypothetical protein
MAHKRGVYHRRKYNLKTLFPSNKEKYLCLTFQLDKTVLLRLILCNESLCERSDIWAYASEMIKDTSIHAVFATLDKQDYMLYGAIDKFNSGGLSSFVNIHSPKQFVMAIGMLMAEYENSFSEDVKNASRQEIIYDEFGMPTLTENSGVVNYAPLDENELANMYQ